jgi:hypothetical protein
MNRRTRKFLGALAMLVFVIVYALVVMSLAQGRVFIEASKLGQAVFYAIAGLAWILPLMPLIRWMERPDPEES